jgi:hypothetical protein
MNGLVRIGINSYYLYQCMPIARVHHHFQVPLKKGIDLVDEARRRLDGYAKRFRFILGHDIGKIEVCGHVDDKLILKQIHARKGEKKQASTLLIRQLNDTDGWLSGLAAAELGIQQENSLLDDDSHELLLGRERVHLTPLEYGVIRHLQIRQGKAVSRGELLRDVWGTHYQGGSNVVDSVVRGLRKKMGDHSSLVETVTGVGYRLHE